MDLMPTSFFKGEVVVGSKRHLIFMTDEQLALLKTAVRWYADGTFKIINFPFTQLYNNSFYKYNSRVGGGANYPKPTQLAPLALQRHFKQFCRIGFLPNWYVRFGKITKSTNSAKTNSENVKFAESSVYRWYYLDPNKIYPNILNGFQSLTYISFLPLDS
jgi:hypothetical protein